MLSRDILCSSGFGIWVCDSRCKQLLECRGPGWYLTWGSVQAYLGVSCLPCSPGT